MDQMKHNTEDQIHEPTTKPHLQVINGQVKTTSIDIAEKFGKQHKHVLRSIQTLDCSKEFTEPNFGLSEYTDSTGRKLPMYEITRDGFTILVMGFTGKKAMAWKERYIAAFNAMEKRLIEQQREEFETGNSGLTPGQQREIQKLVAEKARAMSNSDKPKRDSFMTIYRNIKDRFMVGSYRDVPQDRFNELVAYLQGEQLPLTTTDLVPQEKDHLNAKVDRAILKKMRVYCAEHEMTIQDFIAEAMLDKLAVCPSSSTSGLTKGYVQEMIGRAINGILPDLPNPTPPLLKNPKKPVNRETRMNNILAHLVKVPDNKLYDVDLFLFRLAMNKPWKWVPILTEFECECCGHENVKAMENFVRD